MTEQLRAVGRHSPWAQCVRAPPESCKRAPKLSMGRRPSGAIQTRARPARRDPPEPSLRRPPEPSSGTILLSGAKFWVLEFKPIDAASAVMKKYCSKMLHAKHISRMIKINRQCNLRALPAAVGASTIID